jgi:hypothetical protein
MVKMLQVRRPAFIELTMLSRYEARVKFDVLVYVVRYVHIFDPLHHAFIFFSSLLSWQYCEVQQKSF